MVFRTTVHLRELDGSRLPGASQEAPRSAMVLKVDKLVALATVLPRNLVFHYSNRSMDSEIPLSNIPKQIPTYLYRKEFERTVNYAARCTATIFQKILAAPIYDIPGKKSDQS